MFKITCMKCGEETIFTQGEHRIDSDNNNIDWGATGYGGEVGMWCGCTNNIDCCDTNKPKEPRELTAQEKAVQNLWAKQIIEIFEIPKSNLIKDSKLSEGTKIKIKSLQED